MKRLKAVLLAASLSLSPLACGSSGGGPSVTCTNGAIVANEANDYSFMSKIMLSPVTVKSMSNLAFDWGGVTKDFQGHAVDPVANLNTILVMLWSLPIDEFEKDLNLDMLPTQNLVVSPPPTVTPAGGATTAMLYDFQVMGQAISADMFNAYFDPAKYSATNATFLLAAQTGADLGRQIRMLQAFALDDASTNTSVTLTNSSTMLQYTANLHALHPTGVPAGTPALMLDWGQMTTNALGTAFDTTAITSAIVGHYTQTPAQLEAQFLDLETIATDLYRADIPSGTVLDFTTLKDSAANAFPGVDASGTWLVGLTCGNCRNPAPWYLTVLEPATQPCTK